MPTACASPGVSSVNGKGWGGGGLCRQQSEFQAASPVSSWPARRDATGQAMPRGQGVEPRAGRDQTGARRRPNGRAQARQSARDGGFTVATLEFSRKESAEIKEQAEILKAVGFACLCSLERAGEMKEDIMEC